MINLIIGQNASGKTLYLDNIVQKKINENSKLDFVTNLDKNITFKNKGYNRKRINILEDITLVDNIDTSSELIVPVGSPVRLSTRFLYIMTLLCKDVKTAYIDEPEQGLSEYEHNLLLRFLKATNNTFSDLVIVTHSELLVDIYDKKLYRVEMSKTSDNLKLIEVPEDKKYEIID